MKDIENNPEPGQFSSQLWQQQPHNSQYNSNYTLYSGIAVAYKSKAQYSQAGRHKEQDKAQRNKKWQEKEKKHRE